jgi:transcriptional regulator with XRE-family HTH domain
MSSKNIHLGLRLLTTIRQAGHTQAAMAEAVGTTPNHMSRLVRSEDRLLQAKGELLLALAEELGVTVDWLLGRDGKVDHRAGADEPEAEFKAAASGRV